MKRSKWICIIICFLLVAAILICTLPFPERINLSLQAKAYTREGVAYVADVPIIVKGYRLHYLLRGDKMVVSLDLNDDTLQTYRQSVPVYDLQRDVQFVTFTYYDGRINEMDVCDFVFNDAFTEYAIGLGGRGDVFYVSSTLPDADIQALAWEFKAAVNCFD